MPENTRVHADVLKLCGIDSQVQVVSGLGHNILFNPTVLTVVVEAGQGIWSCFASSCRVDPPGEVTSF